MSERQKRGRVCKIPAHWLTTGPTPEELEKERAGAAARLRRLGERLARERERAILNVLLGKRPDGKVS